jgi:ribonuclease HII
MNREHEHKLVSQLLLASQPSAGGDSGASATASRTCYVIGVDEAGRGPLCGPVVVAACCVPMEFGSDGASRLAKRALTGTPLAALDDSKRMKEPARASVAAHLQQEASAMLADAESVGVRNGAPEQGADFRCIALRRCRVEAGVIDELNILEASLHGMERAVDDVLRDLTVLAERGRISAPPRADNVLVLVDGPHLPRHLRPAPSASTKRKSAKKETPKAAREAAARARLTRPLGSVAFMPRAAAVVRGDALCPAIAAAAVVAKCERDRIMVDEVAPTMDAAFGIVGNVGYPTAAHLAALKRLGPTPHHRRSFAPVAAAAAAAQAAPATAARARRAAAAKTGKKSKAA